MHIYCIVDIIHLIHMMYMDTKLYTYMFLS